MPLRSEPRASVLRVAVVITIAVGAFAALVACGGRRPCNAPVHDLSGAASSSR